MDGGEAARDCRCRPSLISVLCSHMLMVPKAFLHQVPKDIDDSRFSSSMNVRSKCISRLADKFYDA